MTALTDSELEDADALVERWFPHSVGNWRCWCGRRLGCPAALDAHQFDHGPQEAA
jgi:hypothetical protein